MAASSSPLYRFDVAVRDGATAAGWLSIADALDDEAMIIASTHSATLESDLAVVAASVVKRRDMAAVCRARANGSPAARSGFNHDTKQARDREEMESQSREVWYTRATALAGVIRALHGTAKHGPIDLAMFLAKCEPLCGVLVLDDGDDSMRWAASDEAVSS